MITCDTNVYEEAVTENSRCELFLNKKIDFYDEMAIVVGKDIATGSFAKSFADIDLEDINDGDSTAIESTPEPMDETRGKVSSSSAAQTSSRSKRKRIATELEDGAIKEVATQIGELAKSLKAFTKDKYNMTSNLYNLVMALPGFEEEMLLNTFDYLVKNEVEARAFMVRNEDQMRLWVEKFLNM